MARDLRSPRTPAPRRPGRRTVSRPIAARNNSSEFMRSASDRQNGNPLTRRSAPGQSRMDVKRRRHSGHSAKTCFTVKIDFDRQQCGEGHLDCRSEAWALHRSARPSRRVLYCGSSTPRSSCAPEITAYFHLVDSGGYVDKSMNKVYTHVATHAQDLAHAAAPPRETPGHGEAQKVDARPSRVTGWG
jgi:hypothetical protein